MKTMRIIRDKNEVMKKLLVTMYESACAQKEFLGLLLAEFLACGTTKAQSIMNSGILQDRNIAYRAGNRWRFNKTLLAELLQEEPEILNRICSETV